MKIFVFRLVTFVLASGIFSASIVNKYLMYHDATIIDAIIGMLWLLVPFWAVLFYVAFFTKWE